MVRTWSPYFWKPPYELSLCVGGATPPGRKFRRGGPPTSLQYRGEAESAEVLFYMASVAE